MKILPKDAVQGLQGPELVLELVLAVSSPDWPPIPVSSWERSVALGVAMYYHDHGIHETSRVAARHLPALRSILMKVMGERARSLTPKASKTVTIDVEIED